MTAILSAKHIRASKKFEDRTMSSEGSKKLPHFKNTSRTVESQSSQRVELLSQDGLSQKSCNLPSLKNSLTKQDNQNGLGNKSLEITGIQALKFKTPHKVGGRFQSPDSPESKSRNSMSLSEPLTKKIATSRNYEDLLTKSAKYPQVECPHCLRVFAPRSAERHIPICQNLRYRVMKSGVIVETQRTRTSFMKQT